MTKKLSVSCLVVAGIVLAASGCGRGDGMNAVTGTVTFDGQPVESGEILFRSPDGTEGSSAGKITGGRYSLRSTPGVKRVEITARREIETPPAASGEPAIGFESYIPDKYNRKSELTAEVADRGRNTFDFELTP
ncbi:MAG: hypothetical protein RBS80_14135 [Thermoguttaceae bacterium]|jgi:hypothetical protein|nr:hypothetical protein [Thermoguttaceae bacterium]